MFQVFLILYFLPSLAQHALPNTETDGEETPCSLSDHGKKQHVEAEVLLKAFALMSLLFGIGVIDM